jgi:hypothetical protein
MIITFQFIVFKLMVKRIIFLWHDDRSPRTYFKGGVQFWLN